MGIKACAAGFCCADVYQNIGVFYPTGNGIDWGIHLARMGVSVSAVSVVGKDEYGDKMREALAAEGLDISHLRVEDGDTSVMLMALKDGVDRVHLEAIDGVMETYRPNEDDRAFILEHDIIHTDLFGNCLDLLPEWHDAGKTVVMDFSVFSQDPERARRVASQLECGGVSINDASLTGMVQTTEKQSFKLSGMGGSRMGTASIRRFVRARALLINQGTASPWWFPAA